MRSNIGKNIESEALKSKEGGRVKDVGWRMWHRKKCKDEGRDVEWEVCLAAEGD
jgi:hypothetical protein